MLRRSQKPTVATSPHRHIAAAYDTAQDRAATRVIGWLAEHATTRVGPRGEQVQVPVEMIETVTVRHCTSRAGDPHRHLHLQINARVLAAGKWRGLHTVGVQDFLGAINGIGHAAVAIDPPFRAALATHGVERRWRDSAARRLCRAVQCSGGADRPQSVPLRTGVARRASRRAPRAGVAAGLGRARLGRWSPGQGHPRPGAGLTARWQAELGALGYRDPKRPVDLIPKPVGTLDRNDAAERMLARLAAGRSAWNAADIRGEAEQLLAAAGIVADAAVRIELAEDLTARALERCVPLLPGEGLPEQSGPRPPVRCWRSSPTWAPGSLPAAPDPKPTDFRRRCGRPGRPGGGMPVRPRRSPGWPATEHWP